MPRKRLVWIAALVGLVSLVAGVAQAPAREERRKIFMSAVEYKGGASVTDEAYPPADEAGTLPIKPLGGGYELEEPDETGRWEVESYRWEPGVVAANLGERITLEIVGINGARHEAVLVSPSGAETPLVVTRGRMTRVRFQATEAGVWRLVCNTHPPGMTADILVIR